MPLLTNPFPLSGACPQTKLLFLGPTESLPEGFADRLRSLNIEHVSPAELMRREISRSNPPRNHAEDATVARMRRWFWSRKPEAGFCLSGFPATLLQALVFDEWMDARDESLDAVVPPSDGTSGPIVDHYRTLGLLSTEAAALSS